MTRKRTAAPAPPVAYNAPGFEFAVRQIRTIVDSGVDAEEREHCFVTVSIPRAEDPTVTVVIIGWRLAAPLLDAIRSVVASADAPPYEVVVVFNGASDAVREAFHAEVEGAVVVDLPYNTGYGHACNRAAAVARGEFLLFLNDDARLLPDAVRRLVDSARKGLHRETPVGAVAAVLTGEDGRVQEAGSRVLATAGTVQMGAGLTMEQARSEGYLRRRSIDYGSGAGLLVRADLFRRLGGHDPRYRPAYFEDVDLAFRIRAAGGDVILEPDAVVVHMSGGSTDTDRRFREFAGHHAGLAFIERWRDELAGAASEDDPIERICPIRREDPDSGPSTAAAPADEDPAEIALGIARDYEAWLNRRLDECVEERAGIASELEHARSEWNHWHDTAQERGAHSHELYLELQSLQERNLLGIARWRIDLARKRRVERRAQ